MRRLQVRDTESIGLGVYSREDINEGAIIEKSPFIPLDAEPWSMFFASPVQKYVFKLEGDIDVIPTGYLPWYNHSNNPSAKIEQVPGSRFLVVRALRDIKPGEQIFIKYVTAEPHYKEYFETGSEARD